MENRIRRSVIQIVDEDGNPTTSPARYYKELYFADGGKAKMLSIRVES